MYKICHELLIDLSLRILGNLEISAKSQNYIELLNSAQSSSPNENFISTSKNLLKNSSWINIKSFFVLRTSTKKIIMLPMSNVKIEFKKFVMHKKHYKTLNFLCHIKKTILFFFFDTGLYFCCYVSIKIYHQDITF